MSRLNAKKYLNPLAEILFSFTSGLIALLPFNPVNMKIPYGDSGVFIYIGWRILQGEIPYRDVWDHKPPIIYYIDALGLILTQNSKWGIWGVEIGFLFLSAWLGFKLLKSNFGNIFAILGTLLWVLNFIYIIDGGNLTTEYTLPIQFFCLWLVGRNAGRDGSAWLYYLIGILAGISFFIKQNTIGIELAIGIWLIVDGLLSKQFRKAGQYFLAVILGGLTIVVFFVLFFYLHHALSDFWEDAFVYNFFYIQVSAQSRLAAIISGIQYLSYTGLFEMGALGWIIGLILVVTKRLESDILPLISIALLDLPLEILFISLSGESYSHYYLTLLPVLCLLTGLAYWVVKRYLSAVKVQTQNVFLSLVIIGLVISKTPDYFALWDHIHQIGNDANYLNVVSYLVNHSTDCGSILAWGREAGLNFLTQKASPSKYAYQYALVTPGYTNEQMIMQFLNDIVAQKPCYIVDFRYPRMSFLEFPLDTKQIQIEVDLIRTMYGLKREFGRISIYQYNGR